MMHRDLKSPNVLLSEEGVAKIADVGMVRPQVQELVTAQPIMTPLWAAPEVSTALGQQSQWPPVCLSIQNQLYLLQHILLQRVRWYSLPDQGLAAFAAFDRLCTVCMQVSSHQGEQHMCPSSM